MAEIAVVIPVLNRPQRAAQVVSSLHYATMIELEILFVCSPEDEAQIRAVEATGENYMVVPWVPGIGDFARKQNAGFRNTEAPYVFLGADDLAFQPKWDHEVLKVARRQGRGVIGTQDDANPLVKKGRHSTHTLVSRAYIDSVGGTWHDGPGVVYHEGYDHQFVDNELCQAAIERHEWSFAYRSIVTHLHPMYNRTTTMDTTYEKALRAGHSDLRLYRERQQAAAQRSRQRAQAL